MAIDVQGAVVDLPEALAGRYHIVTAVPFGERTVGFRVCLPRDMEPVTALGPEQVALGEFMRIGVFEGSGPRREQIEVAVARPGFDIGLAEYARFVAQRFGCRLANVEDLSLRGRTVAECIGKTRYPGGDLAIRFFLYPHGPRVLRVALFCDETDYAYRAEAFENALATFEMLEPSADRFLEPYDTHTSKRPASGIVFMQLRHPKKWTVEVETGYPPGTTSIALTLPQVANKDLLRAFVRVKAVERRKGDDVKQADLVAAALADFADVGFRFGGEPELREVEAPIATFEKRALFAQMAGGIGGDDADVRIFSMRSRTHAFSVAGFLPTLADDPLGAMHAKRVVDVAARSLNRIAEWPDTIEEPEIPADEDEDSE